MGARTDEPVGRTPTRIQDEIRSAATARRLAEDHGHRDIAEFLRTATDIGLDDLNARRTT
ncbi:hypothetical protein [Streptomyces sp. SID2119]|uniref:hypothetical protein n=1 Tax=Streptomyces sp. SID2119 TaxID=2690253 RepID=UPI0013679CD8|nr:hypothetical protein [Streptomyces sp. SID2119]MYW33602.1 hypothetical protein [Streptomyces sp. SID2119]